jgi:pimeloyl-ACP methyl ester carboxylesterase
MKRKLLFINFIVLVALLLLVLSSGCQKTQTKVSQPSKRSSSSKIKQSKTVKFFTSDGVRLSGNLFGKGKTVVILAHMYPADQSSWFGFARLLAGKGYLAMTFDFRGYGRSLGSKQINLIDRDLKAAIDYIKPKADKIFLIGASMGGTASLKLAAKEAGIVGVISLSAPVKFQGLDASPDITNIKVPKLFIASEGDLGAAQSARWFYQRSQDPKKLDIVGGDMHGTNILKGSASKKVTKEMLDFIAQHQ